jgi:hypothetical protein
VIYQVIQDFLTIESGLQSKSSSNPQQNISDGDFDELLASNKKSGHGGQKELSDADLEDLMSGKKGGPKQAEVNDNEFDSLLNSKSGTSKKPSASAVPVELQWKIHNDNEEEEKVSADGEDASLEDSFEDVNDAFNFTDTEFDANNRDDYEVDTEILKAKNVTLAAIEEVDEESEQTIQRKKCEYEIKNIEKA